ncbi:MAG TPA: hypothetical protein VG122_01455 [Gemmata sp.]|jgi:hypothetical protein|nr:hypothetical protein [Gemmata sp.]
MAFLSLFVLFAADDPAETLAKKMLPIYRKEIAEYSITVESAPKKDLELLKEPVHEWTNPVREGRLVEGVVFLWLRDGRPAALGGIFSHPAPGWEGGHKILHEFLALDRDKLVVSRPNGNNQWTPQEGLARKELSDTASPAASREARLVQMRGLAKEFTGHIIDYEGKRVDLRLLPTPLYRYSEAKTGVVDGALFALVTTEGTDPEVLLVLEAREVDGKTRWEYACGRFGVVSMYAQHKGKEVWSSVLNGKSDVWSHDRLHLYSIYPEKIVTPEGKLLARMRLTPKGEEVIPVGKK